MPSLSDNRKIRDGRDIMLFYYNGSSYTSIAHASSHSLSLSTQTETINSKDYGKFGATDISQITWEISCDHLYTDSGFDTFYSYMMADTTVNPNANKLTCVFGLKNSGADAVNTEATGDGNWTPSTTSYVYKGECTVSSLSINADAGSKATVSATLSGVGPISKVKLS